MVAQYKLHKLSSIYNIFLDLEQKRRNKNFLRVRTEEKK